MTMSFQHLRINQTRTNLYVSIILFIINLNINFSKSSEIFIKTIYLNTLDDVDWFHSQSVEDIYCFDSGKVFIPSRNKKAINNFFYNLGESNVKRVDQYFKNYEFVSHGQCFNLVKELKVIPIKTINGWYNEEKTIYEPFFNLEIHDYNDRVKKIQKVNYNEYLKFVKTLSDLKLLQQVSNQPKVWMRVKLDDLESKIENLRSSNIKEYDLKKSEISQLINDINLKI